MSRRAMTLTRGWWRAMTRGSHERDDTLAPLMAWLINSTPLRQHVKMQAPPAATRPWPQAIKTNDPRSYSVISTATADNDARFMSDCPPSRRPARGSSSSRHRHRCKLAMRTAIIVPSLCVLLAVSLGGCLEPAAAAQVPVVAGKPAGARLETTGVAGHTSTTDERPHDGASVVRAIVVKSTSSQQAYEDAASLSLDLPSYEREDRTHHHSMVPPHTSRGELVERSAPDNGTRPEVDSNKDQTAAAARYRQVSLASLTLHQSAAGDGAIDSQPVDNNGSSGQTTAANGEAAAAAGGLMNVNHIAPQGRAADATGAASSWLEQIRELKLTRHRPSWMNVSSQFKINGTSIEEIHSAVPIEFTLRPAFDAPVLLKTKLGVLEGVRSIRFNKNLYTFLGVPYARAPVGELRFKAPQGLRPWQGVLQATKWPPFCVQPSMTLASKSSPIHVLTRVMTEDCLYMNIWTPSLKFNKHHKRPVMVWIHGGAFQYGGISVDENEGSALALLGDVVVVTLNYRISVFGFLNANNHEQAPNNVGLLDQRMALSWVHDNIRQFGGDPQQVTLFGESAGGHSVGMHVISPGSQPYFKRAIMQSGVPVSMLRSYDLNADALMADGSGAAAEAVSSIMVAKRLRCYKHPDGSPIVDPDRTVGNASSSTTSGDEDAPTADASDSAEPSDSGAAANASAADAASATGAPAAVLNEATLECLRRKSSLDLIKALGAPGSAGFFPTGNDLGGFFPNGPIMDSFEPSSPRLGPQKDFLIGTNTDEGTFMLHFGAYSLFPARAPPRVSTVDELKAALARELEQLASPPPASTANSSTSAAELASASGNSAAQAHLYKPLLRMRSTLLENFVARPSEPQDAAGAAGKRPLDKNSEFGRRVGGLVSDIIFLCPARSLARTLDEAGRNVYFYLFTHRPSTSSYHEWFGVTHHDEVEFVFGRPLRLADSFSGKDIEMSQRMIRTWSHFARTGLMLEQHGVEWPRYGAEQNNYMTLGADGARVGQRYHDKMCNIYDTIISVHLQESRR